jgi:hypothetical protein
MFLQGIDVGNEGLDSLRQNVLTPKDAVTVIKRSVQDRKIPGSHVILQEMDTPQFKRYVAHRLAC